ncbi:hypothetical protein SynBIOSE41_00145 [Synechococcus sp. BIOS-E4-1]|nr:hypothetical protein SynBIOSE41_00145 [Synechococcus sp. BIOS-E4-1]
METFQANSFALGLLATIEKCSATMKEPYKFSKNQSYTHEPNPLEADKISVD